MHEMNSSEFEALLSMQRSTQLRDHQMPTSVLTDTPTLTKAELAELLFDHVGLNKREAKDMVEAFFEVIRDALEKEFDVKLPRLSMGMTNDFPIAVEEGATLVRVGRALFGQRPRSQAPQQ